MLIEMRGIERMYVMGDNHVHALRGVDLQIKRGDSIAIMGTSGSGKSTLMNIMGCLDQPTKGSYLLNGKDVSRLSRAQLADVRGRMIGFVFQSFNLLSRTTALENVEMPLMYQGVSAKERHKRAMAALERVGLHDREHHHPNQLSGGQQQRVAIARALVCNAPIIMADEPTGNLDSANGRHIMDLLVEVNRSRRTTLVLVTHDATLAALAAAQLALRDGRPDAEKSRLVPLVASPA